MGRKTPGLYKRNKIFHIDKQVRGVRICESTGSNDIEEAERYLAQRIKEIREQDIYGVRPKRTFREAAVRYLASAKLSKLENTVYQIKLLDPYIGRLPLESVHMGALEPFIADRKAAGMKNRTVNLSLKPARRILNLAATEWRDGRGMTWLEAAPKVAMLPEDDSRAPYPISWEEQSVFFPLLPEHLRQMALFKVNTGTRKQEVCVLRWEFELKAPELGASVFVIPAEFVKNRRPRVVILNRIAAAVVNGRRGKDPVHVFTYEGKPLAKMDTPAWHRARAKAALVTDDNGKLVAPGLADVRVHDLKHTFGMRLRAAGVSHEDRQELLGHRAASITTHYSEVKLEGLIEAANSIFDCDSRKSPALFSLNRMVS